VVLPQKLRRPLPGRHGRAGAVWWRGVGAHNDRVQSSPPPECVGGWSATASLAPSLFLSPSLSLSLSPSLLLSPSLSLSLSLSLLLFLSLSHSFAIVDSVCASLPPSLPTSPGLRPRLPRRLHREFTTRTTYRVIILPHQQIGIGIGAFVHPRAFLLRTLNRPSHPRLPPLPAVQFPLGPTCRALHARWSCVMRPCRTGKRGHVTQTARPEHPQARGPYTPGCAVGNVDVRSAARGQSQQATQCRAHSACYSHLGRRAALWERDSHFVDNAGARHSVLLPVRQHLMNFYQHL
jgi:hypothetical protein